MLRPFNLLHGILLCALAFHPLRVTAQTFDPAARAAAIAPFVDDQTIAVGRVDFERVDAAQIAKLLGEIVPPGESNVKEQLPKLGQAIKGIKTAFRAGGIRELYAIVSLHDFP